MDGNAARPAPAAADSALAETAVLNPLGLVTQKELAKWLGITPRTLGTQRTENRLPGALAIRIGRAWFYRMDDLNGWLTQIPTAEQVHKSSR